MIIIEWLEFGRHRFDCAVSDPSTAFAVATILDKARECTNWRVCEWPVEAVRWYKPAIWDKLEPDTEKWAFEGKIEV
jgi:hypothetical protein